MRSILCAFVLVASTHLVSAGYMDTAYEWKYIEYLWPSEAKRLEAIRSGTYNASNVMPMDVDKSRDGRVFMSLLGMEGVPATLTTVTGQQLGRSGPLLKPYPDWSWFKKGDCDSITSVFRIAIDKCNRLWVLDTGYLDGRQDDPNNLCEPQLLSFDLNTNHVLNRIKIPKNIAGNKNGQSLLATPIVQTIGDRCEKTTIFLADTIGEGLIVIDDAGPFRLEDEVFRHKENAKIITVRNDSVDLQGGIVGMALSPIIYPGESHHLYFRPLSSFDIYSAETAAIMRNRNGHNVYYSQAKNVLSSQAVGQAFDRDGNLFLGMTREMAITCWNRYREQTKENIVTVAQDFEKLDYPNSLKVIPAGSTNVAEELWVLTNRLTHLEYNKLDKNVVNFHVLKAPVSRLVTGTKCVKPFDNDDEDRPPIFNK